MFRNCPSDILAEDIPIDELIQWCEHLCFALSRDASRAFPVESELYQGIPTIVIVQSLYSPQAPVIVQVSDQNTAIYYVYQAYEIERVAGIID